MTGFWWVIVLCAIVIVGALIMDAPKPMGLDDWGQGDDEDVTR